MFSVQGFRVQDKHRMKHACRRAFSSAFLGAGSPLLRTAMVDRSGERSQAALSKSIKSLNDLVVFRYWAWSFEFGFSDGFGGRSKRLPAMGRRMRLRMITSMAAALRP